MLVLDRTTAMLSKLGLSRKRFLSALAVIVLYWGGLCLLQKRNIILAFVFGIFCFVLGTLLLWPLARHVRFLVGCIISLTVLSLAQSSLFGPSLSLGPVLSLLLSISLMLLLVRIVGIVLGAIATLLKYPVTKVLSVGIGVGAALNIVLAYPVYRLTFDWFVPQISFSKPMSSTTLIVCGIFSLFLAGAMGPAIVQWTGVDTHRKKAIVGGVVGLLAGATLYSGLGAAAAGIAANSPLYAYAFRSGYSEVEWMRDWAIAINTNFPFSHGTAWLLLGAGIALGVIGALFTQTRELARGLTKELEPYYIQGLVFLALAIPGMILVLIVNASIFILLADDLQNVLDTFGLTPSPPAWFMVAASTLEPWLAVTLMQILGLRWLLKSSPPKLPRRLAAAVCVEVGLVSFSFTALMLRLDPATFTEPLFLMSLINAVLGIEFLVIGRRLWQKPGKADTRFAYPRLWVWAQAGFLGGAFIALVSYVSMIAVFLNLLLIPLVFLGPMLDASGSAPGMEWVSSNLNPLFLTHLWRLVQSIAVSGAIGALISTLWGWLTGLEALRRLLTYGGGVMRKTHSRLPVFLQVRSCLWWAAGTLLILGLLLISPRLLAAGISLGFLGLISTRLSLRHVPWLVIVLSFVVCLVGLLLLIYVIDFDVWWQAVLFALFIAPAAILVYRVIAACTGWPPHTARQVTLIGLVLLAALHMYSRQGTTVVLSGVSHYDGQIWQNYTPANSFLGGRVQYQMFRDSQGNLWFGSGTGVVIWYNGEWGGTTVQPTSSEPGGGILEADQSFLQALEAWEFTSSDLSGRPLERRGRVSHFLESSTGKLWVGIGDKVARVYEGIPSSSMYSPSDSRYREEGIYNELELPGKSVNVLLESSDGSLWIGTSTGIIRLKHSTSDY